MNAKIFFRGTDRSEDKDLSVSFDTFDFMSGSNCTVKLHDSFLQDNVYTIDKIVFYYNDLSEQTIQADELYSERALAPLRLIYNIKIENKEDFYEKIGISFAGGSPYAASDS